MEATSVTGPAKNLIAFGRWTRSPGAAAAGADLSLSVATFCRKPDDGAKNAFVQAVRNAGLPIHVISERFRFDRGVIPDMAELVERVRPHVIQSHSVKSHALIKMSGLARGRVWLAFHHGYTAPNFKMKLYNQLDRWSLRSAEGLVTVCEAFVPELAACGADRARVRILHNSAPPVRAADESEIERMREAFRIVPGEKVILTIGRLSKEKGHADLLHALAQVQAARPELHWKAVLAGDGPERTNLERLSEQLGLNGRVIFAGFHSDVAPLYAIAEVFVLPSHSEGSPNVLLEAMSARLPVVATRAGGTPEIAVDGETALLMPVRDPDALARALERMLQDDALRRRLGDAGFERAAAVFSPERYMRTLAGIYAEAVAKRAIN